MQDDARKSLGIANVHGIIDHGRGNARNPPSGFVHHERLLSSGGEMQVVLRLPIRWHGLRTIGLNRIPNALAGSQTPDISRRGAGPGVSPLASKSYTAPGCRGVCARTDADVNATNKIIAAAKRVSTLIYIPQTNASRVMDIVISPWNAQPGGNSTEPARGFRFTPRDYPVRWLRERESSPWPDSRRNACRVAR